MTPDKEATLLAIPEICVDKMIALYHTSLFVGHQGIVKNIPHYERQIFHSKLNALPKILYKRLSYMPTSQTR